MSKIKEAFQNGKALIAFLTCADPDLETTAAAVQEAAEHGADLIELGIPFSDPTAEGPVIQSSNVRALSAGVTTDRIFDMVQKIRPQVKVPLVFVTYANVIFSYGTERFLAECRKIGIDGLLVTDLPFEEKEEFQPECRKCGVDLISMLAPSSGKRTAAIAEEAEGFLCLVSEAEHPDLAQTAAAAKQKSGIPCVIDAAAETEEEAARAVKHADGVVVGIGMVKLLERYGTRAPQHIGAYTAAMKKAILR